MQSAISAFGSRLTLRLLLVGCLAGLLAGCADSERLSDPLSNPFRGDTDRTPTASIDTPTASVQSRPLPPPTPGTDRPVAPYTAAAYPNERASNIAGWTAEGGTPIVMAQGETAGIIATRYGIPLAALLKTNGFASSAQVRPGARLIIPTYNAALAASSGARFASRDTGHAPDGAKLRFVKGPQPKQFATWEKAIAKKLAEMKAEKRARAEKSAKLAKPAAGQGRSQRRQNEDACRRGRSSAEKAGGQLEPDLQSRRPQTTRSLRRNSAGRRTAGSSSAISAAATRGST